MQTDINLFGHNCTKEHDLTVYIWHVEIKYNEPSTDTISTVSSSVY